MDAATGATSHEWTLSSALRLSPLTTPTACPNSDDEDGAGGFSPTIRRPLVPQISPVLTPTPTPLPPPTL